MNRERMRFKTIKDPWCIYELQDGTTFKIRYALKEVWVEQNKVKVSYKFEAVLRQEWKCSPNLIGNSSDHKYTQEELNANIEVENCPYDTKQYERSEFNIENKARVVLHPNLIRISRTSLFDENGDRKYIIKVNPITSTIIQK